MVHTTLQGPFTIGRQRATLHCVVGDLRRDLPTTAVCRPAHVSCEKNALVGPRLVGVLGLERRAVATIPAQACLLAEVGLKQTNALRGSSLLGHNTLTKFTNRSRALPKDEVRLDLKNLHCQLCQSLSHGCILEAGKIWPPYCQ